jgi:predicted ATP-dependent endonuclease of OLD family
VTIDVEFEDQTDEYLRASFSRGDGPTLPLDAAGTSLLQAAQLLSYVALFEPRILVLDEPDSHLHPNNQRKFCKLITHLSKTRNFHILMSAHSRHMLDAMRKSSSVSWINAGKIVEGAERETTALLLDLGALDSPDYFADGRVRPANPVLD